MNDFKRLVVYIIRNFINYFKILIDNNISNIYLPNLSIKNIITVDPNKIEYFNSIPMKFYKSSNFIVNFDWDKENKLITDYEEEHQVYSSCKEIFINKISVEKSKMYSYLQKNIDDPKKSKGCNNHEDIIQFLNSKIKLYENIKKIGLKKNINNNIEFMIDRNNNLVKINAGNHRFAISRILKLKKIPVEIKVMHRNCLENNLNKKIEVKKINEIIKSVQDKYV